MSSQKTPATESFKPFEKLSAEGKCRLLSQLKRMKLEGHPLPFLELLPQPSSPNETGKAPPRSKLSLMDHIVGSIAEPAIKTRFFGRPYLRFRRYLGCYWEAFEFGVVLGHAFHDKMTSFAKLLSQPAHGDEFAAEFIPLIQQNARALVTAQSGEPQSFAHLSMLAEEERIKAAWREHGVGQAQVGFLENHYKIPLEIAYRNLAGAVSAGLGLGSTFPELAERLWKAEHEYPMSREEWGAAKKLGTAVSDSEEPTPPITLARRQEEILSQLAPFVITTRPELMSELAIRAP
jgi:hypothetical protein